MASYFFSHYIMCCKICGWLVIIGALNWGLVGLGTLINTDLNVVNMLVGSMPQVEAVVYLLVGIAGVMKLLKGGKCSK